MCFVENKFKGISSNIYLYMKLKKEG